MSARTREERVPVRVVLALPFLLRVPDSDFRVEEAGERFEVRVARTGSNDQQPASLLISPTTGQISASGSVRVPGGALEHTTAMISFSAQLPRDVKDAGPQLSTLVERARGALNALVNHYRVLANDVEATPLTPAEMLLVRHGRATQVGVGPFTGEELHEMQYFVVFDPKAPAQMGPAEQLDTEGIEALRKAVESGDPVELATLLLLNAQGLTRRGQFKEAIIDMNCALDAVVARKAADLLVAHGRARNARHAETTLRGTTEEIANRTLASLGQPDIRDATAWASWHGEGRKVRRQVVHFGYMPSEDEAVRCFEAIRELCAFVGALAPREMKPD